MKDGSAYLMAGNHRADWVQNLRVRDEVELRVGGRASRASARVADDQTSDDVRQAMAAKYQGWQEGSELSGWARNALIVEVSPGQPSTPGP